MTEQLYRDEPIPRRGGSRPAARTPMNGSKPEAKQIIARIKADKRIVQTRLSTGLSPAAPLPIQPAVTNLPQQYHEMRAISRWEQGANGQGGRWLTEAELFYRQGKFMEDFEDDWPYEGIFKSYFPTYNAMSDRQLRGYFTWRAAVRRGTVEQTSLSFAYVYLYELINGIGVTDALGGFRAIERFWQAYRAFSPEIDRFASVWLQDYAIYHGLPAELLEPYKALTFDRALIALRQADEQAARVFEAADGTRRKNGQVSALPLPVQAELEERLLGAIDALSTYNLASSKLYKEQPEALRHVACAVFVRMSAYHRKHRKGTLLESWFGEEMALPYTMFGSAVFFAGRRHEDCVYELDEIHRYRCERGYWTCERLHGSRSKSPKLGNIMRAVDRALREALEFGSPLKETGKTPKYLQKFIEQEVEAWTAWSKAHAPRRIDIDLTQLSGIRVAAEATRESLLIDEERSEDGGAMIEAVGTMDETESPVVTKLVTVAPGPTLQTPAPTPVAPAPSDSPLTGTQLVYLRSLHDGDEAARQAAVQTAGTSEDLLVDAINEALFDLVGDTVIGYGTSGPELIEDYRSDVEGLLDHA